LLTLKSVYEGREGIVNARRISIQGMGQAGIPIRQLEDRKQRQEGRKQVCREVGHRNRQRDRKRIRRDRQRQR
jgi:hypothetical protein